MDIIDKINKVRYTLKEILSDEWDTSTIARFSNEEIEIMYKNKVDDELNGCNFSLNHNKIPSLKLHIGQFSLELHFSILNKRKLFCQLD